MQSMDSIIESSPGLPEDVVLHRGLKDSPDKYGLVEGEDVTFGGYTSTSLVEDTAKSRFTYSSGSTLMEIRVPKGTKAINMSALQGRGAHPDLWNVEQEMVLPRGSRFKVIKVGKDSAVLELIP